MKKFEIGKIYVTFKHTGIAYDHCCTAQYFRIDRRSDKSLWISLAEKDTEIYGNELISREQALTISPDTLNFYTSFICKINISDYNYEYISTDIKKQAAGGWTWNMPIYLNRKYCTERGGEN